VNIIRIEGCLWHAEPQDSEEITQQSADKTRFSQLMGKISAGQSHHDSKSVILRRQTHRYRLLGGPAAGVICEIEVVDGKTYLNVLVPQYALCKMLKHFSAWLNAGLLTAGHLVTLEVKYAKDGTE